MSNALFYSRLITCNCELVNAWEIAKNSDAKIFTAEEVVYSSWFQTYFYHDGGIFIAKILN